MVFSNRFTIVFNALAIILFLYSIVCFASISIFFLMLLSILILISSTVLLTIVCSI